jgi:hypothetical protein
MHTRSKDADTTFARFDKDGSTATLCTATPGYASLDIKAPLAKLHLECKQ